MRYVVGYSPRRSGRDALNLGIALARTMRAELDVVYVLKADNPHAGTMHGRGNYGGHVEAQAKEWLTEAAGLIPEDVEFRLHLRRSVNSATGLMEMAEVLNAGAVLVGGAASSAWSRHGIGSVDNALLHRSRVPVIMAPRDYDNTTVVDRIDCAVSPQVDSIGLVEEAVSVHERTGLPVRLVTLLEGPADDTAAAEAKEAVERLVQDSSVPLTDSEALEVVVARGKTIPDAVESVDWAPTALLMAGSSKLAQRGELFLSSTTAKILTRLPIPVLVVPRDYHPGRYGSEAQPWTGSLRVVDPAPPRRGNRP